MTSTLDQTDRAIVRATQEGLPLVSRPYESVGEIVGTTGADVIERMQRMLDSGIIRRIAAVPNHYALGLAVNAMTVWDIDDARIGDLGREIGALEFVSHCYHRPRRPPAWPYNLFAMVHGRDRTEVDDKIAEIATRLGHACRGHDVLVSTRILKKTGLRLAP